MLTAPTNVAEDLNNAIYSLASINPSNVVAATLNETWQAWFGRARNLLPNTSWWLAFKGFWAAYAAARMSAMNLTERTPPAEAIEPTLWKTLLSDVHEREVLLADASRATREAAREASDHLGDQVAAGIRRTAAPILFVAAVIGVALVLRGRR